MAAGRHVFNEIVAEPLTKENQTAWFVCIKNFLIARDLWEVVEGTTKISKNSVRWKRKNAEALHIMQISCTPEPFSCIMEVSEAKVAWDILHKIYQDMRPVIPPVIPPEMEAEEVDSTVARLLYRAICVNNWDTVQAIVKDNSSLLSAKLTSKGSTALHVAALFRRVDMVEEFVRLTSQDHLAIVDVGGKTPLVTAIYGGAAEVAKCMVNKNRRILSILTPGGDLPVSLAFVVGHNKMARYLYSKTPLDDLTPGPRGLRLLYYCFKSGNLDIALHFLRQCENFLFAKDSHGWGPIQGIAAMPFAFPSGNQLVFWKRWIYKCIYIPSTTTTNDVRIDIQQQDEIKRVPAGFRLLRRLIYCTYKFLGMKEIHDLKSLHADATQIVSLVCKNRSFLRMTSYHVDIVRDALFLAAKEGTVEFVVEVIQANPELILFLKRGSWHIFFFAVQYRQAGIFRLIRGLPFKDVLTTSVDTTSGNSMLHVAGMLAPSFRLNQIPGAALQMQRELQWFKEVESVVPPSIRLSKNNDGKQPEEVFEESHKELRKEGEEWIKGTASSCSVVSALVVTIMFAAAFTVPGGNNQESDGYPIFLGKDKLFMVFIISDALSLFSSTTSVLIFLGILTSRYLKEDFLKSLPTKLIIGLSSLFISIATMMIAFSATILIMLEHRQSRALLPIILLASIPVTLFVLLQFSLLVQIVYCTYGPSIFYGNVKPWA